MWSFKSNGPTMLITWLSLCIPGWTLHYIQNNWSSSIDSALAWQITKHIGNLEKAIVIFIYLLLALEKNIWTPRKKDLTEPNADLAERNRVHWKAIMQCSSLFDGCCSRSAAESNDVNDMYYHSAVDIQCESSIIKIPAEIDCTGFLFT